MTADIFDMAHARASTLKPNTPGAASFLTADKASLMSKKQSGGISRRLRQLTTADALTPAKTPVFVGPPKASITSSTVVSMLPNSSHSVKKSSLHAMELAGAAFVAFNKGVAESLKSLGKRLEITREALDLSAAQLCKLIECKPNRWSQYESGDRKITLEVANALCDEFGLSLDWIYRANPSQLPHALRLKIRQTA